MNAQDIVVLRDQAVAEIRAAGTLADLEAVRIKYLGRKGLLPVIMEGLKDAAPAERPEIGRRANEFKQEVGQALDASKAALAAASSAARK